MYKIFSLILLVICISFCNKQDEKYYLKNKWETSSSRPFKVRFQPKKLTENFYSHVDSIDKEKFNIKGSIDEYYFNTEGDIVLRKFTSNDLVTNVTYHYSANGYVMEMEDPDYSKSKKKSVITFELKENGKFLEKNNYELYRKDKWYEYKNNGSEIITEQHYQHDGKELIVTEHFFYKGDCLQKRIAMNDADGQSSYTEDIYYYDKQNIIDSLIRSSGKKNKKTIYEKNRYGDPVVEYHLENVDTIKKVISTYLYDSKGNWIRRFEKEIISNRFMPSHPNSLVIRKIDY